jgi:hypothetical protein
MGRWDKKKQELLPAKSADERWLDRNRAWRDNPSIFIQEALLDPKGARMTRQQREATEQLRRLVGAKRIFEAKYNTMEAERYPKGSTDPTKEDLAVLYEDAMSSLKEVERKYARKIGISIMSGKGTGKDAWTSWVILWFQYCFFGSLIPCTAPTAHQLSDVLWAEISRWLNGSLIQDFITWQASKIYPVEGKGQDWKAIPLTANPKADTEAQATTLSGLHSRYMMIVGDEAQGIPDPVFRDLDSTMTSIVNFAVLIFNPTRNTGYAVKTHESDRWIQVHWDAEESENVSRESIKTKEELYGRDSNYFRVYVKGLPPVAEEGVLIPWDWVHDAIDREIEVDEFDELVFGVDVGGGGDASIIAPRRGGKVYPLKSNNSPDSVVVGDWVALEMDKMEAKAAFVDVIGLGNGAYGELRRLGKRVYPVDVRRTAPHKERFDRLRDELWWKLRDDFQSGTISIPNNPNLIAQLSVIRYSEDNGKVKVEGKKSLKGRGEHSPDEADAVMHTKYIEGAVFRKPKKSDYYEDEEPEEVGTSWMRS